MNSQTEKFIDAILRGAGWSTINYVEQWAPVGVDKNAVLLDLAERGRLYENADNDSVHRATMEGGFPDNDAKVSAEEIREREMIQRMDSLITTEQRENFYGACKAISKELRSEGFASEDIDKFLTRLPQLVK